MLNEGDGFVSADGALEQRLVAAHGGAGHQHSLDGLAVGLQALTVLCDQKGRSDDQPGII